MALVWLRHRRCRIQINFSKETRPVRCMPFTKHVDMVYLFTSSFTNRFNLIVDSSDFALHFVGAFPLGFLLVRTGWQQNEDFGFLTKLLNPCISVVPFLLSSLGSC